MQTEHNIETLLHQSNIEQDYTHSSTIFLNTVKKKIRVTRNYLAKWGLFVVTAAFISAM